MSVNHAAISAVFRLLGRWFPPPPLPQGVTYAQLHEKWKRFDRVTDVLFLPFAVALSFLFYFLFRSIDDQYIARLNATYGTIRYLLNVSHVEYAIAAIFIGFFATPLVGLLCVKLYLAERWPEFVLYGGQKMKMHPVKVLWILMPVGIVPVVIIVLLRIGQFTAFTDNAVLDNNFFSFTTREYPYTQIRGIYDVQAFHGRFQDFQRPEYALRFADGSVWTTSDHAREPRPDYDGPVIQFVSEKSGRTIQKLHFEEDVPHAPDSPPNGACRPTGFPAPPGFPVPPFGPPRGPGVPPPPLPGFRR